MRLKSFRRFIAVYMLSGMITTTCMLPFVESYAKDVNIVDISTPSGVEYNNEMITNNYTVVSRGFQHPEYKGDNIEYSIEDCVTETSGSISTVEDYDNSVIDLTMGDTITFEIDVPESALYYLSFDYMAYESTILPVEVSMKLNGESTFYEMQRLVLESTWVQQEEKAYDRYGNEIVTVPDKAIQWENKAISDASYRYSEPFLLELEKGVNTVTLEVNESSMYLGNVYLYGREELATYVPQEAMSGKKLYTIEAEEMTYRNDSSIRAVCEYDSFLTPYSTSEKVLNVIDSASFADPGQMVGYEFEVEESGYYYLGFAYRQSSKSDFPVFADIRIDGEIPNSLLQSYPFPYTKDYKNLSLKDSNNDKMAIYLEAGVHTIGLTISSDNLREYFEAIDRIMYEVNDLALEITKVAGTNKDKYRDLKLSKYIPDIESRIINWADQLDTIQEMAKVYNTNVKNLGAFSSLSVASSQLRSLAKDVDNIPYRIAELAQSTNSVVQYLANCIDSLNGNDMALDKIFVYQADAKLPEGAGFFESSRRSVVRFFSSFNSQAYATDNTDSEHLQVWVNRSRQYVEIMQRMIDESFTPQTGIKVDLSIMPDPQKLVLANASGDAPDVAQSINYTLPYELAIRGALKDLTEFEGYEEVLTRVPEGLHVPATIDDGIYAMPETINFWVLFYRSDILDKLGLEVPNTMEDVKNMLPELQIRGLNFYYPTAGMIGLKNFHGTTPLLYQYGATLYGDTAGSTTINSEAAIQGFTELTELFTIYNLPADVPNFYQHFRNGDLPIGIGDYGMYNLLINAAPEIADSWDVALIPGVEDESGEVLRYTCGGAESLVIFEGEDEREQMAWEYMKWWTSTEVQAEFGQTLQVSYGSEYIWSTANVDAFLQLPWSSEDKKVIQEQTQWLLETPRIPGTYMLERELSNAYNDVVVNGKNLRITLDNAVKNINRETERKLEEFRYIVDGEEVKEYKVPNLSTISQILGRE